MVLPNIFATQPAGNVAASLLDTNFTYLESQGVQAVTTTGTVNAYIASPADAWVTGYVNYKGRALTVTPNFTNTGAATINVSGLGNASIYKNINNVGTALAAGDMASGGNIPYILICDGGNFLLTNPTPFDPAPITNSLSADVTLNNAAAFFDGPSIAQGTAGTWFVSGTVSVVDTGGASTFIAKLWDGTTVIAASLITPFAANANGSISLSGYITAPAGNLKISVKDSQTAGKILFNASGTSKDSTITAVRIK